MLHEKRFALPRIRPLSGGHLRPKGAKDARCASWAEKKVPEEF